MDQLEARKILDEAGVIIGPDDNGTEVQVVSRLVELGVLKPAAPIEMGGRAIQSVNLPPLKRGRSTFAG